MTNQEVLSEKEIQRQQHMRLEFPLPFTISLGAFQCNRRCRMCPMYNMPPSKKDEKFMPESVFRKSLQDVGSRKVDLELSAYGEPTLHPQFDEFISLAKKACPNAHLVVNTNGTMLTEERCRKIIDSGLDQLVFSLDAGSAQSYKWLTGCDDYNEICKNLELLVSLKEKLNANHLQIQTHIIGIKELEHEFDSFINRWKKVVDFAYVRTYGNWAGLVDNNGVTPCTKQTIPNERYPCSWLWYATKIEPNGDVSKCFVHVVGDKDPIGNIMHQDFYDIWHGEKMQSIRQKHLTEKWDDLEFCKDCIVWSLFPHFWKKDTNLDSTIAVWK